MKAQMRPTSLTVLLINFPPTFSSTITIVRRMIDSITNVVVTHSFVRAVDGYHSSQLTHFNSTSVQSSTNILKFTQWCETESTVLVLYNGSYVCYVDVTLQDNLAKLVPECQTILGFTAATREGDGCVWWQLGLWDTITNVQTGWMPPTNHIKSLMASHITHHTSSQNNTHSQHTAYTYYPWNFLPYLQ